MANIIAVKQPVRTIDLGDGVERKASLTLNALAELELKYGSVEEAFNKVSNNSIAAIRFLLWLVLVPEGDEDLTEKQVGALINLDNLNDIMECLMSIFEESMPQTGDSAAATGPNRQSLGNW